MKLLLRFLFTLTLVFFGSAQRSGAHLYADGSIRVQQKQIADHARVVHIADRPHTELRTVVLNAHRGQDELAASDNENEDDREDEERQLTAKQLPPPHFFQFFLNDNAAGSDSYLPVFTQLQSLDARCAAPEAYLLFQVFLV